MEAERVLYRNHNAHSVQPDSTVTRPLWMQSQQLELNYVPLVSTALRDLQASIQ